MKIETKLKKGREKVAAGLALIAEAQAECKHPDLEGEYGSNTGNWCEQDDCYWINLNCPTCGKRWQVDSDQPEYREYGDQKWNKRLCKIKK